MKDKLKSISNIPFLVCLATLLLNDFYFKSEYHNWLTGKLSDFCGLFVFVSFWASLFPRRKQLIYVLSALLFIIWKSPYSQIFIDIFSKNFYSIHRVVDLTDLIALLVLPIAFFYSPQHLIKSKLYRIPLSLLTIFALCATSIPRPSQKLEQPQYLLFKSGLVRFESGKYPSEYTIYELDSVLIIGISEIIIDRRASMDDEFHKVQILKDIELRLLREAKHGYRLQGKIYDYKDLRDSLVVRERTSIALNLDTITDHLNFKQTRLDGLFQRFSNDNKLLIDGVYKNGIEDSIWTFYNKKTEIATKKYFKNGELTKVELFSDSKLKSESNFNTRSETIRNKYFHVTFIFILILGIVMKLYSNSKKLEEKAPVHISNLSKIAGLVVLPLGTLTLAKLFSGLIPNSYSTYFLGIFGEVILIYLIVTPLYLVIFYCLKLSSKLDLLYYILASLAIVLAEELIYLKNIV